MTGNGADRSETVRPVALERIGVAGSQDSALVVDEDFEPALQDDSNLFAGMREWDAAGIGAGLICLAQHLELLALSDGAYLLIRDAAAADFMQVLGGEEDLLLGWSLEGEELGQPDRQAV